MFVRRVGALAGRSAASAALCLLLAGPALGANPRTDKTACATCHREESQSFPQAAMAIGMELPPNQQLLKAHPKLTLEQNGYTYEIEQKSSASTYTVRDSTGALTLPIQYAF